MYLLVSRVTSGLADLYGGKKLNFGRVASANVELSASSFKL